VETVAPVAPVRSILILRQWRKNILKNDENDEFDHFNDSTGSTGVTDSSGANF